MENIAETHDLCADSDSDLAHNGRSLGLGEGPYRYMRHPGYLGQMIFSLASALALGSLWALIPGGLFAGLLVVRTALEDRTLQDELEGYKEYTQRVRYRLIPHIW